jgi:hypothetical protein
MMKRFSRGVGVLGLVVLLLLPSVVSAQQAGQGLEISPPLINLKAKPGDTVETEFRIRHVTDQTLVARAQYNDFVAGNEEDGNPKILLDSSSNEPSPYTIKDWIRTITEVTLSPNEQKVIKISLKIPGNASPGGHYGVIRFTGTPPEVESSSVALSASIGTLVLVTVSGNIKDEASIAEIYTSQNNKKRSVFEYGPVSITTRFKNSGNVHNQPTGNITVTNMIGRTVETLKFNESNSNVLPQSIRKFENTLNKKLLFGRYKVQADLVYGADKNIITQNTYFWVIPYKLIAIGIGLIALLVFAVRKYNVYIIKRAQQGAGDGAKAKANKKK